ncbi:Mediator of RNA polymerase II transcription subunit 6 [Conglomerata obtusa]
MDELENICFRNQAFLNTCTLTDENILDYFSESQFYDSTCTNEVLKMQTKYTNLTEIKENLSQMKGTQYILFSSNDDKSLFVISKINRISSVQYETLCIYYIMNGTIFQAPTNKNLYDSRVCNAFFYLYECLDLLCCKSFDCFAGFDVKEKEHLDEERIENYRFYCKILNEFQNGKFNR